MNKFKKILLVGATLICSTTMLTGCSESDVPQEKTKPDIKEHYLHIATGNTMGTYYIIGGAMSELLNEKIPDMHCAIQTTTGSIANVKLLADDVVELAIIQNDIASYAVNGSEMFKGENKYKFDKLRGLATLYPESCQCVTTADSGINSISDLRGKKVAVGAQDSGAEANARQILEVYGLSYDDIQPMYMSFSAASKALKEGSIDAAFLTAGAPTLAVQDVASQMNIKLLPIDDEHFKTLSEKYPFYSRNTIEKGTYRNFDEDVQTASVMAILACNDKVDNDLANKVVKTIFDNLNTLKSAHPVITALDKNLAVEKSHMTIPFQEGAEKFFKE